MKKLIFIIIILSAGFLSGTDTYAQPPEITAQAAVLADAGTGIVIYSSNGREKLYPASITKLMTVLLTLEYAKGFYGEEVYFSQNAVESLPWDSSGIGMSPGETLTLDECLYAIMLASANEVANAVAEHIAGSIEGFAAMMNERAKELGCVNTSFKNPHGLHDSEHYTCAYDMALIMGECIKHPDFIKYFSTRNYVIPPTQKYAENRIMNNTNRLIQPASGFFDEDVAGGKTGFTDEAGHTLVTFSRRGGADIICSVMKTPKNGIYTDTSALINYGFSLYEDYDIFDKSKYSEKVDVSGSEGGAKIDIIPSKSVKMFLPNVFKPGETEMIQTLPDVLEAPVKAGDTVGSLSFVYQGINLAAVDLIAASGADLIIPDTVPEQGPEDVPDVTDVSDAEPGDDKAGFNVIAAVCAAAALIVFCCCAALYIRGSRIGIYTGFNKH